MKRKKKAVAPSESAKVKDSGWPPFLDPNEIGFLVRRVQDAAVNNIERRLFTAILRRAYEDVMELESLYSDLPGVLARDFISVGNFRKILDKATARSLKDGNGYRRKRGRDAHQLNPKSPVHLDRARLPLFKPTILVFLLQGVSQIAGGSKEAYDGYVKTLRELWRRTHYLERFYSEALAGIKAEGRNRLGEDLRLLARDIKTGAPYPELDAVGRPSRGVGFTDPFPDDEFSPKGSWPPPPDDAPIHWPPDEIIPEHPHDYYYVIEPCLDRAIAGIGEIYTVDLSTYANGITSIAPERICDLPGRIIISGSFPTLRPDGVDVLVGSMNATVVSWSSDTIIVEVPRDAVTGCVGFIDRAHQRLTEGLSLRNERRSQEISGYLTQCFGHEVNLRAAAEDRPTAPCSGANLLLIGPPRIESFLANGRTELTVEPGQSVVLTWDVRQAQLMRISRIGPVGPWPVVGDVFNPPVAILDLGPFDGTSNANATYEIAADNDCGSASRRLTVRLGKPPALRIVGVEITQAIQRFASGNPSGENNSVRLVTNKRTLARVYIESGIENFGANEQPDVTGSITVFPDNADHGFSAGSPLNPSGVVTARPSNLIQRGNAAHTLNFELPFEQLSGVVRIDVRVWVRGHEDDSRAGWRDFDNQTTVNFQPRRNVTLQPILVRDDLFGVARPTMADYNVSLQGARTRFPIAENGFLLKAPIIHGTRHNLTINTFSPGWGALLVDIKLMALDSDEGEIWTAVVPNAPAYTINGIAVEELFAIDPGAFIAQARLDGTFAHEMAHVFGFLHAPACLPPGETPDGRLPAATEDFGWDVSLGQTGLIPSGRGELMSYNGDTSRCPGARRWPSIAFYDILFDQLS